MNEDQLRRELDETYRKFDAADRAGDADAAKQFKDYGTSLENRLNGLNKTAQKPQIKAPPLAEPTPEEMQAAGPALQELDQANKDLDKMDDVEWGDHWKSIKASGVGFVADRFQNWAMEHRLSQSDALEEQQRLLSNAGDALDPAEKAKYTANLERLKKKVARGEQVDPTFYGTFVKPFFSKDGREPHERVREVQDELLKSRSDIAQEKAAKPFLNPDATMDNAASWFEGTAMPWEDLDSFLLNMSQNSTQLTAGIVAARLGGRMGAMSKARQLRSSGIVNPSVVRAASAKSGAAVGTVAASATDYYMVRDHLASSTQEALRAQWEKEELWQENGRYTDLLDAGFAPETAKQVVTDEIATLAGKVGGVASAILGAPMNKFWAKLGLEGAVSRTGSAGKGALMEMGQEGIQETAETVVQNIAENQLDPSKPLTAGIGNAFFGGVAMGAAVGGPVGALSGGDNQAALNKDQKSLNKAGFSEWREVGNKRSTLAAKVRDPEYIENTPPAQRVSDFEELEKLQYQEAKAFQKAEPSIRKMQKKYGVEPAQVKRTDRFSQLAKETIDRVESDRLARAADEDAVATQRQRDEEVAGMLRQVDQDLTSVEEMQQTKTDLDTIAGSGLLETEEQHQRLVDAGYGRWRNKAKEEFVLTRAGQVARESLPEAIAQTQEKMRSGYAGEDRREDRKTRKKLEKLPAGERKKKLRKDPVTKVQNRRAFEEDEKEGEAPAYAAIDVDSLGYVNDKMEPDDTSGHDLGDRYLRNVGKILKKTGLDVYRTGGDEFVIRGGSEEEIEEALQVAAATMAETRIAATDGTSVPLRITWATGTTASEADARSGAMKKTRQAQGKRAAKGEKPIGWKISEEIQPDLPLMSLSSDEGTTAQIIDLKSKRDEYNQKRRSRLKQKLEDQWGQLESEESQPHLDRSARLMSESLSEGPSDTDLKKQWLSLPETAKKQYEIRAAEFYTPMMGEHIDASEVYTLEHGGNFDLRSRFPSKFKSATGNNSTRQTSALAERLSRIINEGTLPQNVMRELDRDVRKLQEMGMDEATTVDAMIQRVHNYLSGEYTMGGPTPFSSEVDTYNMVHEQYSKNMLPKMSLGADPIMGAGFYRDLGKGDAVEVIVDGQSIKGTVLSETRDSVVVRWDNDALVLDPDTRQVGNSARFSKTYGWQSSARLARGGTSYGKQINSWPGQARLGRRFNTGDQTWETMPERQQKIRTLVVSGSRSTHVNLSRAAKIKAKKNEMRRARQTVDNVLAGYRNLPRVQLANTVADLPAHMQEQLVAHGSTGVGVNGMFDEQNPVNGVWLLVGNIAQKARTTKGATFDGLVAEAVVHETIGHYGMRGFMGGDRQMALWMDAVVRSFPKEAMAKAREYSLVTASPDGKTMLWRSEAARRLAGEELLAEISQYIINNREGYTLTEPQRGLVRTVLDHIKTWMIDHGFGRFMKLDANDLYRMLWQSQNFARNGKGWEYQIETGETLVPYMRDTEIFTSALMMEFVEKTRSVTKEERKQMQAQGLEARKTVPVFNDNMNRQQYLDAFIKLAKDSGSQTKEAEIEFTGVRDFLDTLTWREWLAYGDTSTLPSTVKAEYDALFPLAYFDESKWYDQINQMDSEWRNAEKLRDMGVVMGQDMAVVADARRAALNKFTDNKPTQDDIRDATLAIDQLMNGPVGKRQKIPRGLIHAYLNRNTLSISVVPDGGYTTGIEDPDVTDVTWSKIRPSSSEYSRWVPQLSKYDKGYNNYVFFQDSPSGVAWSRREYNHYFSTPRTSEESFMHFRAAEGLNAEGNKAYVVVEVQSDPFQGKENSPESEQEKSNIRNQAERLRGRINGGSASVLSSIKTEIMDEMKELYQVITATEEVRMSANRQAAITRAIDTIRDEQYESIEKMLEKRGSSFGRISTDDARAFDRLDVYAQEELARVLQSMIRRGLVEMKRESYNEDSTALGEEVVREMDREISSQIATALTQAEVSSRAIARLMGKPDLIKSVFRDVLTPFTGINYGLDGTFAPIWDKAENSANENSAYLPPDVGKSLGLSETATPGEVAREINSMLMSDPRVMAALGWSLSDLNVSYHGDKGFKVSSYGGQVSNQQDAFPLENFPALVRALLSSAIKAKVERDWDSDERRRISRAEYDLSALRDGDEVANRDEALVEINWQTGDGEVDAEFMDRDRFADIKTQVWRDSVDVSDLIEDMDWEGYEYDGHTLDRTHPEYRERITVDDDGDADTSDAEDWMRDVQWDETNEYYSEGNPGWDQKWEDFADYFDENYSDTETWRFSVPIAWDEDGNPTAYEDGTVIHNEEHSEIRDADSDPVDTSYSIRFDEDYDYEYEESSAQDTVLRMALKYYANNDITPPEGSAFRITVDPDKEAELRQAMIKREKPDFSNAYNAISEMEITEGTSEKEGIPNFRKMWEQAVMLERRSRGPLVAESPLKKSWQQIAMKFALADAVRKGYDSIVWQSGEAVSARGGEQNDFTRVNDLEWEVVKIPGRDGEFIKISGIGIETTIHEPNMARLGTAVGIDVASEIMRRAKEATQGDDTAEVNAKRLASQIRIVPVGERFGVIDASSFHGESGLIGYTSTALTAETMRAGVIRDRLAAMEDPQNDEGRVGGTVSYADFGGAIHVANQKRVTGYVDSFTAGDYRGKGARTGYDITLPGIMNKLVKRYGGKVESGVLQGSPGDVKIAVSDEGGRRVVIDDGGLEAQYPNIKVEQFFVAEKAGYLLISDNGPVSGHVHDFSGDANEELSRLRKGATEGIKVHEVKITEEMRNVFGAGKLPIMMKVGFSPDPDYKATSTKDPLTGEQTLVIPRPLSAREGRQRNQTGYGGILNQYQRATGTPNTVLARAMMKFVDNKENSLNSKISQVALGRLEFTEAQAKAFMKAVEALHPTFKPRAKMGGDGELVYLREAFDGQPLMSKDPIAGNPALESLAKKVGQVPRKLSMGQRWDKFRKDLAARTNQGIFDRFYGIKYAMDRANWQGDAEKDPYITARLTTSLDTQMEAIMKYGYPAWDEGMVITRGTKGLMDILAPVSDEKMLRAWSLYMVAKRAQRLRDEGRENLLSDTEIYEGIQLGYDYPIFEKVAREYAAFNSKVLDFAEEAGIIDGETRPLWESADYVPFYRVQDDRLTGALHANVGVANQRNPIKRLKGGEDPIGDIPANIIQNITNLVDASTKNLAATFAVDALKGTGIVNKIPNVEFDQALVPMDQVKQRLIAAGMNPAMIPADAMKGLQKMFVMKPPSGEGVISIQRDGKREHYQTTDRLLWESMTQINRKQFGRWISLFRGPKRFLTAAVTLDPGFMIANYIRDLGSSYVQSRDVKSPFTHMARSLQGLKQAALKDESFRTMMGAGSAFSSGYMNYGDPNSVHRAIRRAQRSKGFRKTIIGDTARSAFDFYKEFGASFENSNRIAVYNEAIANGKSKKQAAFEAKDLMDFSMSGSWGAVQFLVQSVPFLGARLQGLHRLGRGFADDPVAFAVKGMLMTMAGMALWFRHHDDERYIDLEEWDKDTYYHFWIGNEHFRIPKPFEAGAIFNTIPERAFEYAYNDADDAEKLLMNRFGHMLGETFAFNPLPQVVRPAFESAFNHNFFTGRQIVSPYTEKRLAPEQRRSSTSPSLVEIAQSLPEGLDKADKKFRSPLHLENLYRGYTGTLGRYAMFAADEFVRWNNDMPEKPTMQPADYPVLGRFYRGTDDMPRRTKYEETFYDLLRKTEDVRGSLRVLEKEGNEARLEYITGRYEPLVGLAPDLNKARQEITRLNNDMQAIWSDSEMSAEDKRAEIDIIQEAKNAQYKAIYEVRPGAKGSPMVTDDDLTYLMDEYGVDETANKIQGQSPATASLMRDITTMTQEEIAGAFGR